MHPAELLDPGGSMYLYSQTRAVGHRMVAPARPSLPQRGVAQTPSPSGFWSGTTIEVIASVLGMWPLSLDGLGHAVRYLVRGGDKPRIGDPSKWGPRAIAR